METRKVLFHCREWLNKPGFHGNAYVSAEVAVDERESYYELDINLSLADCSRMISLDFGMYRAEDELNALYKLDLLTNTFLEMRRLVRRELKRKGALKKKAEVREARRLRRTRRRTTAPSSSG